MNTGQNGSRRNFIRQSALGIGAGVVNLSAPIAGSAAMVSGKKRLREIVVATVDLKGLKKDATSEIRINRMLERMEGIAGAKPDIICLPELFNTMWVQERRTIAETAEEEQVPGPVTSRMAAFAREHSCYVVCPLLTKKNGHFYNSSVLIDRKGAIAGVYHKTHPVKSEIFPDQDFKGVGVKPGELDQPVIETDFGKIGMQICYDANWPADWAALKKKGADLVLFPSAFPGGRMLNYYARQHNYYVVSSTGEDGRIIDISGNDLDVTSEFVRCAWATVNLDKVSVTTWPTNGELPAILKKYGNRLRIKVWGNTDVITMESRDPQLEVGAVLREFDIPTYAELLVKETAVQNTYRPQSAGK